MLLGGGPDPRLGGGGGAGSGDGTIPQSQSDTTTTSAPGTSAVGADSMLEGEIFPVDPEGVGTPQGLETEEQYHLSEVRQAETSQHEAPTDTGGNDPHAPTSTSAPDNNSVANNSEDYENWVKAANNDPTVNEPNSHRWDGSQPVTNANGAPIDKGWAGPDAVRNYGSPDETWIESKSNVAEHPDFMFEENPRTGQLRNFNQLARYATFGHPFEYWVDAPPAASTRLIIEDWGGTIVIFR